MSSSLEKYRGQWFVLKIGGELALDRTRLAETLGAAVREMVAAGIKVVIIHGGGPQASALSQRLGLKVNTVRGRRVTDPPTLEVIKMTLAGQVSVDLAAAFLQAGVKVIATTGVSAALVLARKRPPIQMEGLEAPVDFGWVGDVVSVNTSLLERWGSGGLVPLIGSICGDVAKTDQVFNVNADTVAGAVASELKALKLLIFSNVSGVLRDRNDRATRIPLLTPTVARALIISEAIQGGMIPKVEESLALLDRGVKSVHILGIEGICDFLGDPESQQHGTQLKKCDTPATLEDISRQLEGD